MQTLWTQAGSAITAALSAIGGPTTPGANILPNGGFEQPASVSWQIAAGWTEGSAADFAGANPNDAEVLVQTSQTDGGTYALECGFLPGYSFATTQSGAACGINTTGIPVIPGETYTITGDMLSTQPAGVGWDIHLVVIFTVAGVSITSLGQYVPSTEIVGNIQHLTWPVPAGVPPPTRG